MITCYRSEFGGLRSVLRLIALHCVSEISRGKWWANKRIFIGDGIFTYASENGLIIMGSFSRVERQL